MEHSRRWIYSSIHSRLQTPGTCFFSNFPFNLIQYAIQTSFEDPHGNRCIMGFIIFRQALTLKSFQNPILLDAIMYQKVYLAIAQGTNLENINAIKSSKTSFIELGVIPHD